MSETSHSNDADAGGTAHTKPGEPHPDLQKETRTDRDVGGPTLGETKDQEPQVSEE